MRTTSPSCKSCMQGQGSRCCCHDGTAEWDALPPPLPPPPLLCRSRSDCNPHSLPGSPGGRTKASAEARGTRSSAVFFMRALFWSDACNMGPGISLPYSFSSMFITDTCAAPPPETPAPFSFSSERQYMLRIFRLQAFRGLIRLSQRTLDGPTQRCSSSSALPEGRPEIFLDRYFGMPYPLSAVQLGRSLELQRNLSGGA